MYKRLLISFLLVFGAVLLSFIPVPGVSLETLNAIASKSNINSLPEYYSFWSKYLSRVSIGVIGIVNFLGVCIFVQILSLFIASLRKKLFGSADSGAYLFKLILVLSVVFALIKSYFISVWIESPHAFIGYLLVPDPGIQFRLLCSLSMAGGFLLLLLLAEAINRYGLGNGYALVFIGHYLLKLPVMFLVAFNRFSEGKLSTESIILTLVIFIAIIVTSVWATRWIKYFKIPTESGELKIPLRLSWLGREPIYWAGTLIVLPTTIMAFIPALKPFRESLNLNGMNIFLYLTIYAALIFATALLYIRVVYKDSYLLNMVQNVGFKIQSVENVKQSLNAAVKNLALIAATFLAVVACLPVLSSAAIYQLPYALSAIIRDFSLVILVGIIIDMILQAKFYKDRAKNNQNWILCHVAFDETEEVALCQKLNQSNVETLVKPSRFIWRLPIRTPVERYQIYVSDQDIEKAKQLCKVKS